MGATQQALLATPITGSSDAPVITGWGEGFDGSNLGSFYEEAVNLAWDFVIGADEYKLYRATAPDSSSPLGAYTFFSEFPDALYRDSSVNWASGASYGYKVTAHIGSSESGFSNSLRFDVTVPPPPSSSYYLRPDGVSYYHRPDGTSRYTRP